MSALARRQVDLEATWKELQSGISSIITDLDAGCTTDQWMHLYTSVYKCCTNSQTPGAGRAGGRGGRPADGAALEGADLYEKLKRFLETHLSGLLKGKSKLSTMDLLRFYHTEWERYIEAMRYVNKIFMYLNRHWVKREREGGIQDVYEVYPLALVVWRDRLFTPLKPRLLSSVLGLIAKERAGEQVDYKLISSVAQSYVDLGLDNERPNEVSFTLYKREFEKGFLEETAAFYKAESNDLISGNVVEYMTKVEKRLDEEVSRVSHYLHSTTEGPLTETCEQMMIARHLEVLTEEFPGLLKRQRVGDLTRMYRLLNRRTVKGALEPLQRTLEEHIKSEGLKAVEALMSSNSGDDAAAKTVADLRMDPKPYIEVLLEVYKQYSDLVATAFANDAGFVAALDKACRSFINTNAIAKSVPNSPSRSPELLARFTDGLLKKSNRHGEDAELDQRLGDVMAVFKFIEDKDVFLKFYSKMLAKRLIHATSANEDAEGMMIAKMKQECGYEYTTKLQRMFTDMTLSRDLNDKFRSHMERPGARELRLDLNVLVLVTGSWPLQPPTTNLNFPPDLGIAAEAFHGFYTSQHSGRKMTWLHQLGKVELKSSCFKSSYMFQSSVYQTSLLVMFNTAEVVSWKEMMIATDLSEPALKSTLTSLLRFKLLKMEEGGTDIGPGKSFSVNTEYKSKRMRVVINVPLKEELKVDSDATLKTIEEDRKLLIQAAIVRIMKARKALTHVALMNEVIKQVKGRFLPRVPVIKKCIDILIEKDYLERGETKDMLKYIS